MSSLFGLRLITIRSVISIYFVLSLLYNFNTVSGQGIPVGQWRDHLPYNDCIAVAEAGNNIFAATPYCLFYFNRTDNSINKLNKVNGLSDFGVSTIKYCSKYKYLIVAYTDANIDLIYNNGNIINFSDIENSQKLGNLTINKITIKGDYAYLACGFGIVVFNTLKREIEDTYYIAQNGDAVNVFDITFDTLNIYAATAQGIYKAALNSVNLADYNSWSRDNTLPYPNKAYNHIVYYNNILYANQVNSGYNKDSMYINQGNGWIKYKYEQNITVHSMEICNNNLLITGNDFIDAFDTLSTPKIHVYTYNPITPQPLDAIFSADNTMWIGDRVNGLISSKDENSFSFIIPSGPATNNVFNMASGGGSIWVVTGGVDGSYNNLYSNYGVYLFSNEQWTSLTPANIKQLDSVSDYISVAIDPNNTNQVYVGTWSLGLIQFQNSSFSQYYNITNSSLRPYNPIANYEELRVGGICFDANDNMWMTNPGAENPLSVRQTNGKWKSFNLNIKNNIYGQNTTTITSLVIDDVGQQWMILPRGGGIIVYNDGGTITDVSDDQSINLINAAGSGNLPSLNVYSIANDLNGEIWVGTDQGVAVFYSPGNVFTPGADYDAQQILVNITGHWEYLLATETVTAIAVDGANRKWFGTLNSGVYLMSADGTQQIEHFTSSNSPLFSNAITCIAINQTTGEVFFGTNNGIISYRGTATAGANDYSDKTGVFAYPNPVTEGYSGPVVIKGLVTDSDVKITGITGNLVYHTTALGGQAIWYATNFSGEKVQTGVYLVYCSNDDGTETIVTKILVIK